MTRQQVIFCAAITLILAACGDSGKHQNKVSGPMQHYLKISTERPSAIGATPTTTAPCSLDAVDDKPANEINSVADKAKVKLSGWAGNVADGISPREVWVEFGSTTTAYLSATRGKSRPDVASALNKPGLADAGWETYGDLSPLANGTYKVSVLMLAGQQSLTCDTKRSIKID